MDSQANAVMQLNDQVIESLKPALVFKNFVRLNFLE